MQYVLFGGKSEMADKQPYEQYECYAQRNPEDFQFAQVYPQCNNKGIQYDRMGHRVGRKQ